jgi:hypothetical protein
MLGLVLVIMHDMDVLIDVIVNIMKVFIYVVLGSSRSICPL